MLDNIQKKIITICIALFKFFKEYLAQIVFLVFALQLLSYISTLPYFNLINKYYFYVAGILWVFSNFLFKNYIKNDRILKAVLLAFILDIPLEIFDLEAFSDTVGFAAFLLLFTYVLRQIFLEKRFNKGIRDLGDENKK